MSGDITALQEELRMFRMIGMLGLALVMVSCGVKGDLYLPEDKKSNNKPSIFNS